MAPYLPSLTPGESWVILQQSGVLQSTGKGKSFVLALSTGRLREGDIEQFLNEGLGKPIEPKEGGLPSPSVTGVLKALGVITQSSDEGAIKFLVASAKAKLWRKVFHEEEASIQEARTFQGSGYADTVRTEFLSEYEAARALQVPAGYAFKSSESISVEPPFLMQRLVASRLQRSKRLLNCSGTGTGKTNSGVLASRVIGARLTVVTCPNSVVDGWVGAISGMFPDSEVASKTFTPVWKGSDHCYVVWNYEMLQQSGSEKLLRTFVKKHSVDFAIIDEIQFVKQRTENISHRREMMNMFLGLCAKKNPDLHVLGLSATPVVNNLREAVALIEMVTGEQHKELETKPTTHNCMKIYQRLMTLGPRWLMDHKTTCTQREVPVDCSENYEGILRSFRKGSILALEEILTQARLPTILAELRPRTVVYSHYIGGKGSARIDRQLYEAISAKGWKVGFYTGQEKSGLDPFRNGQIDILIASSAIATGVDGLQHVCNRLVVNILPWTAAEFDQLLGRFHRQGQRRNVEVILPITFAIVKGVEWSWCRHKLDILQYKRTVADSAVDGVVPEGQIQSPEKVYQNLLSWLERLHKGESVEVERPPVFTALMEEDEGGSKRTVKEKRKRFGDFSKLNAKWNFSPSQRTHERLKANPAEWDYYHGELSRIRTTWPADPQEHFLRWARLRPQLSLVGDFGCGRAKVRESLKDSHVVHSFDHVSCHVGVVACDMSHVPLENETLDVALFCLSLMGSNVTDYIREAFRVLRLDGVLHIYEPTSRIYDRGAFQTSLEGLGFERVQIEDVGSFTHVSAMRSEVQRRSETQVSGLGKPPEILGLTG